MLFDLKQSNKTKPPLLLITECC